MKALEVSAKTVEEAVERALNELKLTRSEVKMEVLQEGKAGLLGWGGENARVRVTPLPKVQSPESRVTSHESRGGGLQSEASPERSVSRLMVAAIAREVVETLLRLMDVTASVEVGGGGDDQSPLTIEISDGDLGVLIGRRGQTLSELQYVVSFIISRKFKGGVRVTVDVAGYRKRREEELQNMALRVAELVKSTERSIPLEPMPSVERRVIHLTLRNDPDLATQSEGFGDSRKVVIYPRFKVASSRFNGFPSQSNREALNRGTAEPGNREA
ncbi:MAG: RNA-binding cell elongation regulator Jag/EloR [Dehalococcoidia bacterium]|nr:hypothetical protein [Chloroflexota bacterium]MBT9162873.1 hypothetical protein [Chloroflexota bacterium]